MLKIGIIGGNEILSTSNLLKNMFLSKGLSAESRNHKSGGDTDYGSEFASEISSFSEKEPSDILIDQIYINDKNEVIENAFDILIINSLDDKDVIDIGVNGSKGIILLNSDEKNIFKALRNNIGEARIITYGLNSKACVTASSISDTAVQCCIQRTLPTFSDEVLEQQEFIVKADTRLNDVNTILAVVTTALVNGSDKNFDFTESL